MSKEQREDKLKSLQSSLPTESTAAMLSILALFTAIVRSDPFIQLQRDICLDSIPKFTVPHSHTPRIYSILSLHTPTTTSHLFHKLNNIQQMAGTWNQMGSQTGELFRKELVVVVKLDDKEQKYVIVNGH